MRNYTRQLVTPLLALIQDYGIALEAHMQNTLVHLGPKVSNTIYSARSRWLSNRY